MLMVTGANGRFAQAAIRELQRLAGHEPIAVTTRDPHSPSSRRLAQAGVDVRQADFGDRASLAGAFRGVRKVLIVSTMAPNDVRFQLHANAIDAAQQAGVGHVIYTSFINAGPQSLTEHSRLVHAPTEAKLAQSGLDFTILRHSLYAETLLDDLDVTLETGVFARPGGSVPAAYIARDDLGLSAAHVLVEDGHEGRTYTETMTVTHTGAEIAAELSRATGRDIRYEAITSEAWPGRLADALGLPEELLLSAGHTMRALEAGEFERATGDFELLTGRAPATLREFLTANVAPRDGRARSAMR